MYAMIEFPPHIRWCDTIDPCPNDANRPVNHDPNPTPTPSPTPPPTTPPPKDSGGDGVPDYRDNCPTIKNGNQWDTDGDGVGDMCDSCLTLDGRTGKGNGGPCDLKMKSELEKMAEGLRHEAEIEDQASDICDAISSIESIIGFGIAFGPAGWIFSAACFVAATYSHHNAEKADEKREKLLEKARSLELSAERWDDGCKMG